MSFKYKRLRNTSKLTYCNINNLALTTYCFSIKILINAMF